MSEDVYETPDITIMDSDTAHNILQTKPLGVGLSYFTTSANIYLIIQTYLVRRNEKGLVRVSYITLNGVKHKVVKNDDGEEYNVKTHNIVDMIEQLKKEGKIEHECDD